MKIAILGAGFTGLSAAYELTKHGYTITVFEKEPVPSGLAAGFRKPDWQWSLEKSYHHLFPSDWHARNLLSEIGMYDKLFFKTPVTASLYANNTTDRIKIYQLDSPVSLIRFPLLSLTDRLYTGAILAYLKLTPFWKKFEKTTSKAWLSHFMGEKSWKILWKPLFMGKFGSFANEINMAWFWARIKKRSQKLGYIKGGFQEFARGLAAKIENQGGKILYDTTVTKIRQKQNQLRIKVKSQNTIKKHKSSVIRDLTFDTILSTLPTPIFTKITPQLPKNYVKRLQSIPHLHALSLVLELSKPFLPPTTQSTTNNPYWLNICDPTWPFLAVVEHTNFISPKHYGNSHLVYIGNYLPKSHKFFSKSKEDLIDLFLPYLARINPLFNFKLYTVNSELFYGYFAQPVITLNYSKKQPEFQTPIPNLYLANLDSVYPWDRGTNYAIELGQNAVKLIMKSKSTHA